jgi:hypothetical protein
MQMKWHHLAFNAQEQVGYGEYTFKGNHQYHGIVTVVIKAGKIFRWREYQYQSDTAWDDFVGSNIGIVSSPLHRLSTCRTNKVHIIQYMQPLAPTDRPPM